jgi:methyltransferase (TIGR00027 family)
MPIENISDTAHWVAVYRALESKRSDALFNDSFAERLAGPNGAEIAREANKRGQISVPMIVRTAVFDEMIMDRVRNGGVDTVVNLAAGLDTRPWRLPLPSSLHWIDVDLPAITKYKADAMRDERPACNYEAVAADLTDAAARDAALARVTNCKSALFISEGLLVYLSAEQVGSLARAIHSVSRAKWWLFDLASPTLLPIMNKSWGKAVAAGGAPFQFAPEESTGFFDRFGWREAEFRSGIYEAKRLNREMRTMPLWRFLVRLGPPEKREAFRRMNGYVMLERRD